MVLQSARVDFKSDSELSTVQIDRVPLAPAQYLYVSDYDDLLRLIYRSIRLINSEESQSLDDLQETATKKKYTIPRPRNMVMELP